MERCRSREAVVVIVNPFDGELDLEMSLKNEILKVKCFAVFLEWLRPLGLSKVNPLRRNFDRRRFQKFIGGNIRVYMPVVGDGDIYGDARTFCQCPCGIVHACLGRRHVVHIELLGKS